MKEQSFQNEVAPPFVEEKLPKPREEFLETRDEFIDEEHPHEIMAQQLAQEDAPESPAVEEDVPMEDLAE